MYEYLCLLLSVLYGGKNTFILIQEIKKEMFM